MVAMLRMHWLKMTEQGEEQQGGHDTIQAKNGGSFKDLKAQLNLGCMLKAEPSRLADGGENRI